MTNVIINQRMKRLEIDSQISFRRVVGYSITEILILQTSTLDVLEYYANNISWNFEIFIAPIPTLIAIADRG